MTAWLRYEKDFAGRYCPVVYHDEKPKPRDGASAAVHVPADLLSVDGSPILGRLKAMFPAPVEEE